MHLCCGSHRTCLFWAHAGTHQLLRLAPGTWPHDATWQGTACHSIATVAAVLGLSGFGFGFGFGAGVAGVAGGAGAGAVAPGALPPSEGRERRQTARRNLAFAPVGSSLAGFSEAPLGQIKAGEHSEDPDPAKIALRAQLTAHAIKIPKKCQKAFFRTAQDCASRDVEEARLSTCVLEKCCR